MTGESASADRRTGPSVAICAITYRRPEWLERLLTGLFCLEFTSVQPMVKIVIVENEAAGPGKDVSDRLRARSPFPLEFAPEPRRGIPYARNTALELAGEVDFYAILDDDESPDPKWLEELLVAQARYGVDLVSGPVLPVFEQPPPRWIETGRFYLRKRHATGTRVRPVGTNNVLIRRGVVQSLAGPFDERFALTGSSDTHLFKRLERAGCSSVWADEAIVYETIPASRANARWLLRRAYRTGTGFAAITLDLKSARWPRLYVAYLGLKHLVRGFLGAVPGIFLGRAFLVAQGMIVYRGWGMLAGLSGRQYQEYKTIHGK